MCLAIKIPCAWVAMAAQLPQNDKFSQLSRGQCYRAARQAGFGRFAGDGQRQGRNREEKIAPIAQKTSKSIRSETFAFPGWLRRNAKSDYLFFFSPPSWNCLLGALPWQTVSVAAVPPGSSANAINSGRCHLPRRSGAAGTATLPGPQLGAGGRAPLQRATEVARRGAERYRCN